MPSEAELPKGPRRDFVAGLFELYRAARRPTLQEISSAISRAEVPGTASTETVRRMLHGTAVPRHWAAVDAVLVVLCEMSGRDPDGQYGGEPSWRETLEGAWHRALDKPDGQQPAWAQDPWSDEPPF